MFDNILAIDTSTKMLRLGLQFGGDRLIKSNDEVDNSHGQMLVRKIQNLLGSADLSLEEVEALVVCVGPGSFTGLRIALSAVKGIAVVRKIPVVDVSLFEIAMLKLKDSLENYHLIVPFIRNEFFITQLSADGLDISKVEIIKAEDILSYSENRQLAAIGFDATSTLVELSVELPIEIIEYDASELLYLGMEKLQKNDFSDIAELEPLYIKKSQAEINFDRRFKK